MIQNLLVVLRRESVLRKQSVHLNLLHKLSLADYRLFQKKNPCGFHWKPHTHHWLSCCFLDITTSRVVNEPEDTLSEEGNDPNWQPLKILSHQEVHRNHPFENQRCSWKCSFLLSVCFPFAPRCFPNELGEILVPSKPFGGLQERLCSS